MTDEAHRTQYDVLAANMRAALPNAAFIGFTGTPLMAGEEKTREVFGDYVSIYDFQQSVEDQATVPLYYENRIPELQLINEEHFNEEMEEILEAAELDEQQEKKLEREFGREYHLITRDERLETIAEDLVDHLLGRGYQGKAMVVSVDRPTAVRMYDKVKKHWNRKLEELKWTIQTSIGERRDDLLDQIRFMEETDTAVVIPQAQNEIADFKAKGLDIVPHRKRMVEEDLETKFKDPDDPFRIVFVCSILVDDRFRCPERLDGLPRQADEEPHAHADDRARQPRVGREAKRPDRRLRRRLPEPPEGPCHSRWPARRAARSPSATRTSSSANWRGSSRGLSPSARTMGVDVDALKSSKASSVLPSCRTLARPCSPRRRRGSSFSPSSLSTEEALQGRFTRPGRRRAHARRGHPRRTGRDDPNRDRPQSGSIDDVMEKVEKLLDRSIAAEPFVIRERQPEYGKKDLIDLSQIDFELLREKFDSGRKRTQVERLKAALGDKLEEMVQLNRTTFDSPEEFEEVMNQGIQRSLARRMSNFSSTSFCVDKEAECEEEQCAAPRTCPGQLAASISDEARATEESSMKT